MSFSKKVKEELYKHMDPSRHCELSELSALLEYSGSLTDPLFNTDNEIVARKGFTLFEKTFNMGKYGIWEKNKQGRKQYICRLDKEDADKLKKVLSGELLLERTCCKRAYLRGAFIASGSVSDPSSSYHLEFVAKEESKALRLVELLKTFDIQARVIDRKGNFVVYIKDGEGIVNTLNVMEAFVALMDYENARILKGINNSVNRKVNCETANIEKTVVASIKQIEAIEYAIKSPEYKRLPQAVKEIASLRLEYPDASLKELGELCNPKVGKSGVNHRLRRIMELYEDSRK
ncbi:MAG: DNA-binding protein WhiA [Lachnospiraceae bacterium]|nr:DNA-binding protein WhiA [Lachnospiraceae bacterium]